MAALVLDRTAALAPAQAIRLVVQPHSAALRVAAVQTAAVQKAVVQKAVVQVAAASALAAPVPAVLAPAQATLLVAPLPLAAARVAATQVAAQVKREKWSNAKGTIRNHSGSFKAEVAGAALRGDETLPELAQQYQVHWTRVSGTVERKAFIHLARYIGFYNSRRPHSALDGMKPDAFCFKQLPTM